MAYFRNWWKENISWDSDMYVQCNNKSLSYFPIGIRQEGLEEQEEDINKAEKLINYQENTMGTQATFITEMLPTEIHIIGCILNLPKSKNFQTTIYHWQPVVCEETINISDREIGIVTADEIRATIINDK